MISCPFLNGKADVVFAVNSGVVHQRTPVVQPEFGKFTGQLFKWFKEGFVVGTLRLLISDFFHDRLTAGLGFLETQDDTVVAFLLFSLVGYEFASGGDGSNKSSIVVAVSAV